MLLSKIDYILNKKAKFNEILKSMIILLSFIIKIALASICLNDMSTFIHKFKTNSKFNYLFAKMIKLYICWDKTKYSYTVNYKNYSSLH